METNLSEVAQKYYQRCFMEALLTAAGPEPLKARPGILTAIDEEFEEVCTLAGYAAGLSLREESLMRGLKSR